MRGFRVRVSCTGEGKRVAGRGGAVAVEVEVEVGREEELLRRWRLSLEEERRWGTFYPLRCSWTRRTTTIGSFRTDF
uniref:Uncharacterized protein n=1 Tax=Setaria viridis TaxID=4556 RepID=A0A4U6UF36_SETVI|nr:hypothetical protein SEVIR_5G101750v2 [Setaria viridis]